jgi:hypothetical protein
MASFVIFGFSTIPDCCIAAQTTSLGSSIRGQEKGRMNAAFSSCDAAQWKSFIAWVIVLDTPQTSGTSTYSQKMASRPLLVGGLSL